MITFISLNEKFIELAKNKGLNAQVCRIENYKPIKPVVFYVSPSNSLGFMDGNYDLALSRIIFPNIEKTVKLNIKKYGKINLLGRYYLPIGSSIINETNKINNFMVSCPTMLLPQDVSNTSNCYFATIAALYNIYINCKYNDDDIEIILTSMCCGWGKMTEENSLSQIIDAIETYKNYKPVCIDKCILLEPNLDEQPKYYQNTEWKEIHYSEIIKV